MLMPNQRLTGPDPGSSAAGEDTSEGTTKIWNQHARRQIMRIAVELRGNALLRRSDPVVGAVRSRNIQDLATLLTTIEVEALVAGLRQPDQVHRPGLLQGRGGQVGRGTQSPGQPGRPGSHLQLAHG